MLGVRSRPSSRPTKEAVAGQQQEGVAGGELEGLHVWQRAHALPLECPIAKSA
jgi:hypothetical protein